MHVSCVFHINIKKQTGWVGLDFFGLGVQGQPLSRPHVQCFYIYIMKKCAYIEFGKYLRKRTQLQ